MREQVVPVHTVAEKLCFAIQIISKHFGKSEICRRISTGETCASNMYLIKNGTLTDLYPFEEVEMVTEYRKQVGLSPLSDF